MTEEAYKQEHEKLVVELQNALSSRYYVFWKVMQIERKLEQLDREYREVKEND